MVQTVNILGHDGEQDAASFEFGQRQVPLVRFPGGQFGIVGQTALPMRAPRLRIFQIVTDSRQLLGLPNAARTAIVRYARLRADARSG